MQPVIGSADGPPIRQPGPEFALAKQHWHSVRRTNTHRKETSESRATVAVAGLGRRGGHCCKHA
eukprot:5986697-Alexandrium_andersonii.AAC.1